MVVVSTIANLAKISFCIIACLVWSPLLILAHLNRHVGQAYYWLMFATVDFFFLRRQDRDLKDRLFKPLRDAFDESTYVKTLEIGPGAGTNFAYLPANIRLTTLEENPYFKKHFATIQTRHPTITIEDMLIGNAENMVQVPDESFDVVIGTHIFCCIDDYQTAAKEIFRVLKPGGKFFFLDIVSHPKKMLFRYMVQKLYAPFWYFATIGCKAGNIDAAKALINAGFDVSRMETEERPKGQWFLSVHYFGTAMKPE